MKEQLAVTENDQPAQQWSCRDLLSLMCRVFKLGENEWDVDLVSDLEQVKIVSEPIQNSLQEPGEIQETKKRRRSQNEIALKWRQLKVRMLKDSFNNEGDIQELLLASIQKVETLARSQRISPIQPDGNMLPPDGDKDKHYDQNSIALTTASQN